MYKDRKGFLHCIAIKGFHTYYVSFGLDREDF